MALRRSQLKHPMTADEVAVAHGANERRRIVPLFPPPECPPATKKVVGLPTTTRGYVTHSSQPRSFSFPTLNPREFVVAQVVRVSSRSFLLFDSRSLSSRSFFLVGSRSQN